MKMWIRRIKKIIRSNKGETLMETIVSLIILSILLLAVTTMIQTALRMTSISIQNAEGTQDNVNFVILSEYTLSEYSDSGELAEITFTVSGMGISASHDIILNKEGNIIAFTPKEEEP